MIVTGRSLGQRRPLFRDWSIAIPPIPENDDGDSGGGMTLADLIERVVREQVKLFQKRQQDDQFIRALTSSQIQMKAEKGSVKMGGSRSGVQEVDEEQAVHAALQAFEDGLYLVIIDEIKYENLNQQVFISEESRMTFIRLTMLSGA